MRKTLVAAALVLVAAIAVTQPAAPAGNMPMNGMTGTGMDMPKMPDLTADQLAKMDAALSAKKKYKDVPSLIEAIYQQGRKE